MEFVCERCKKEFTERYLKQNDLREELNDLEYQLKELQQHLSTINSDATTTGNISVLNNFGSEDLSQLPYHRIEEDIQDLMEYLSQEELNQKGTKIQLDKHLMWQTDFVPITLFRYFIRMIYRNDEFPQNKTIRYNKELNTFEYHYKEAWKSINDSQVNENIVKRMMITISDLLITYKPIKHLLLLENLSFIANSRKLPKNIIDFEKYEFWVRIHKKYLYIEFQDKYKDVLDNLQQYVHS